MSSDSDEWRGTLLEYLEIVVLGLLLTDLFAILILAVSLAGILTDFNWGIFVPGMIAVIGSFSLYLYREERKKRKVKAMLREELKQMSDIEVIPETIQDLEETPPDERLPSERLPPATALQTHAYDSNSDKLGVLNEDLMSDIVEFYSEIRTQKSTIHEIHSDSEASMKAHENLCDEIDDLVENRNDILDTLS